MSYVGNAFARLAVAGSVMYLADKLGKFLPAANRLADAAAGLAHTAKNGPAQPWLAQAFFGRRKPARGGNSIMKAKPKKQLGVTARRSSRCKAVTVMQ